MMAPFGPPLGTSWRSPVPNCFNRSSRSGGGLPEPPHGSLSSFDGTWPPVEHAQQSFAYWHRWSICHTAGVRQHPPWGSPVCTTVNLAGDFVLRVPLDPDSSVAECGDGTRWKPPITNSLPKLFRSSCVRVVIFAFQLASRSNASTRSLVALRASVHSLHTARRMLAVVP